VTRDDMSAALAPYGALVDDDGTIVNREGRRTSVALSVKRGRLVAEGNGRKLYTGPAVAASVARFVESFWYWRPVESSGPRTLLR
jgi:hypothetical protein